MTRFARVAAILAGALAMGALAAGEPGTAVPVALLVVGLAVAATPTGTLAFILLTFPSVFVARRIGPGALNMSVADLSLVIATVAALPWVPWQSRLLRRIAGAVIAYELVLSLAVVAHPTGRAIFEWAHRGVLVMGSVVVGAAVARAGVAHVAARLLYLTAAVVSVAAVADTLTSGLEPGYPLGMQKNFAGGLLALSLIVLWVTPAVTRLPPRHIRNLRILLLAGLLATQSRGAMAGVLIALVASAVLHRRTMKGAILFAPVAVVLVIVLAVLFNTEAERRQTPFTPKNSRERAYAAALRVWHTDPVFGGGLRYFKAPGYAEEVRSFDRIGVTEPHSVLYVTLAESGLVGIVGLVFLLGLSYRALRHERTPLASVAAVLLLAKLTHGLVDIYWVAGTQSLPWLFVGIACAGRSRAEDLPSAPAQEVAIDR